MKSFSIKNNPHFIGRCHERLLLEKIGTENQSAIVLVYGRRRVGKTELIEQSFRKRNLLKFEGVEGLSEADQIKQAVQDLAKYTSNPLLRRIPIDTWFDFFDLLIPHIRKGRWTLYFEEVQWLSHYQTHFIAQLKKYWDNAFRHNPQLVLVLCGSAPSFMINAVVKSKALYNRSQHEIPLGEFSLAETKKFLRRKRSPREIMDAYLSVGGIPEYLNRISSASSLFLGLCQQSFIKGGFFVHECDRIFVSSLADHKNYRDIVNFLSQKKQATRNEIANHLKTESGGTLTQQLADLELCGFIEKYVPFFVGENSLLARYCLSDAYLQFYFKFIKPVQKNIEAGVYNMEPSMAIKADTYHKWLGFAFERFCRRQHHTIAKKLGFGAVNYRSGAFYNRKTEQKDRGFQIDLIFDRDDRVFTICEIKYTQAKTGISVIDDFEKKLAMLPNPQEHTIHKVLISATGSDDSLEKRHYFDDIITLDDFLN